MSGTTNTLVKIGNELRGNRANSADALIGELEGTYRAVIEDLYANPEIKVTVNEIISEIFGDIRGFLIDSVEGN